MQLLLFLARDYIVFLDLIRNAAAIKKMFMIEDSFSLFKLDGLKRSLKTFIISKNHNKI
jgi:hypothetical protein